MLSVGSFIWLSRLLIIILFLPSLVLGLNVHSVISFSFNSFKSCALLFSSSLPPFLSSNGSGIVEVIGLFPNLLGGSLDRSISSMFGANLWLRPKTSASRSFLSSSYFFFNSFNSKCLATPFTGTLSELRVEGSLSRILGWKVQSFNYWYSLSLLS